MKNNIREIFGRIIDFVIKYKRYFMAGLVFVVMMIVLFKYSNPTEVVEEVDPMEGVYEDYTVNENEELATLIQNYYDACASGDTDTVQTLATPICDQEISYISFYSQYVESYTVENLYTKRGLTDDSYIVSAVIDLKFVDIATAAPGVDFFYVQTNDEGALYINNLYGSFNQSNGVYDLDPDITSLIATFIQQDDVLALEAEVQQSYNEAILSDDDLSNFVTNTLQTALAQWSADYQAQVEADEAAAAEAAAAEEAEKEAQEQADAEAAAEAEEEANAYTGVTTSKINVRTEADKDSDKLGQLEKGTEITIYAEEGDWYKIGYNDEKGYVLKEYVSTDATDDEATTSTTSSIAEGTEITLSDTINIRSQMDSSSSKVAVAYAGETVTVVMSYAEGWTKVKYGKKEGYIRTDLLQ